METKRTIRFLIKKKRGKRKENKGLASESLAVHIRREVEARLQEDVGHL